ncbi:dTMP kinase [Paratissierella segnis]|uniref:Thymidylate kinase n=1 Tax=Paratissierella segnis TaxID=2763679 RepID=A0A926EVW4_9FIRM|nr:dTMP kinase [Paratissierella segnis]MBC8587274.1 dTMP kinase [Paratissierella segnis]
MRGKFITLEGPDGSGKSTILNLIGDYLERKGIDFIISREPGGTVIGEKIRDIVLDNKNTNMGPETEALLYAAARGQHVYEKIMPALESGKTVVCDRFVLSSLAYQGVGRDLGIEKVKMINDFGLRGIYPDLILFFHIDPELTLKRKMLKEAGDRLEQEGAEFHRKVYQGYMELLKKYPKNIKIIDADKSINEVLRQSIIEVENLLF